MNRAGAALDVTADTFAGFAMTKADYSKGARHVQVRAQGIVKLTVGDAAALDVGDSVYASDNQTFSAFADSNGDGSGTDHLLIGRVHRIESGDGVCVGTGTGVAGAATVIPTQTRWPKGSDRSANSRIDHQSRKIPAILFTTNLCSAKLYEAKWVTKIPVYLSLPSCLKSNYLPMLLS